MSRHVRVNHASVSISIWIRNKRTVLIEGVDTCDICQERLGILNPPQDSEGVYFAPFDTMVEFAGVFSSDETKAKEYTFVESLEQRFISCGIGVGLVTNKNISTGCIVFAEDVAATTEAEFAACQGPKEVNAMLGVKARAMGPEWLRKILTLPRTGNQDMGVFAGIWNWHQLPVILNGKRAGILGFNLASVNHACLPNCTLTIVNKPPKSDGSHEAKGRPVIRHAVVHALRPIAKGEEITVAYFYARGRHTARELFSKAEFGFFCLCRLCAQPNDVVEDALDCYWKVERFLNETQTGALLPATAFQAAQAVIGKLVDIQVRDARIVMLWTKCAIVAGFHSDVARAMCFLAKACKMLGILEGSTGVLYRQIRRWHETPTLLPGFGATTRGLSTATEGRLMVNELVAEDVLFMTIAEAHEYIRIARYHQLSTPMLKAGDARYLNIPRPATEQDRAQEMPEARALSQGQGPIAPKSASRRGGSSNARKAKKRLNSDGSTRGSQVFKDNKQASTEGSSSPEMCTDRDWDMLDMANEVMADNPDMFPEYRPRPPTTKPKKKSKGKEDGENTPIVKDVSAEKKVAVKKGEALFPESVTGSE
ncbi:uncharacterized protein BDW43DRAFT_133494 [Aspergillus alliaceus]|uniref:uncharacterized protein n=1 Tax=Petromyces alliaceus TaxID=209559 RepID=UPI0012A4933A|nr:uncharacterized protein BDW43DRAFT_133494 [Aspergillus alliaceus]KAB8231800.1 hypothetical protein BDW43DRAFT_133494 [Aspergillus alliaceus]